MKITDIRYYPEDMPLKVPFVTSKRRLDVVRDYVLELYTDTGLVGRGACSPTPVITGDTEGSICYAFENTFRDKFIGMDVDEGIFPALEACLVHNTSPKAALDIALYDLLAKEKGQSIYEYLGGKECFELKTDVTVSLDNAEAMAAQAQKAVKDGFSVLKIKLGTTKTDDVFRIKTLSAVLDKNVSVRFDANQAWSPEDAVEICEYAMESGLNIDFIEQPVEYHDIKGLAYVKNNTKAKILADECVFSPYDAKTVLENNAADIVNIKLMKCGGIYQALKINALAKQFGAECMIGCMMEGPYSVAAAAMFAAANGITRCDLDAPILCKELDNRTDVAFEGERIFMDRRNLTST